VVFASEAGTVRNGDSVRIGDDLTTGPGGFLQVSFADGGFITLQPSSEYRVDAFHWSGKPDGSERAVYRLVKGCIRGVTGRIGKGRADAYDIVTAYVRVGVHGVGFNTRICDRDCGKYEDGFYYKTWEGTTTVKTANEEMSAPDGADIYVPDSGSAIRILSH